MDVTSERYYEDTDCSEEPWSSYDYILIPGFCYNTTFGTSSKYDCSDNTFSEDYYINDNCMDADKDSDYSYKYNSQCQVDDVDAYKAVVSVCKGQSNGGTTIAGLSMIANIVLVLLAIL